MRNLRLIQWVALAGCLSACSCSSGDGVRDNLQTPKNMPAPMVRLVSFRILFEDGRELLVKEPEIRQVSNPGYISTEWVRVERLKFRKWTTTMGVRTEEKRDVGVADVKAIEYSKNKLNWCITLLSLADGGWLAFEDGTNFDKNGPQSTLDRLPKGFLDRFPEGSLRSSFRDYYPPRSGDREVGTYHLRGRVGDGTFQDNSGDLFACPAVEDNGHFLPIKKVEFNRGR